MGHFIVGFFVGHFLPSFLIWLAVFITVSMFFSIISGIRDSIVEDKRVVAEVKKWIQDNEISYKHYIAKIEYSGFDTCFIGYTDVGLGNELVFQGKSIKELQESFKSIVDNYLDSTKKINYKTYKG